MPPKQTRLDNTDDLLAPDYRQNIYKILPTALRCLGVNISREDLIEIPEARKHIKQNNALHAERVIVCIVDSMGAQNIQGTKLGTFFKQLQGIMLSSVFPTITSAAIPSINFGVPPTTHGILGHVIYFKEYGALVDTLRMSGYQIRYRDAIAHSGINVKALLWTKGISQILQQKYPSLVVAEGLPREIPGTGLGRFFVQKENIVPYHGFIDAFGMVRSVLEQYPRQALLMTLYLTLLDDLAHKYGPYSSEYKAGCSAFYQELRRFIETLPTSEAKKTTVILCSDHGQNPLDQARRITLTQEQLTEIKRTLKVLPGHSGRVTHFYCQSAIKRRKLKIWLQEQVEDRALIFDAKDLDRSKILPVPSSRQIIQRLGDLILIARDGANLEIERNHSQEKPWGLLPPKKFLGSHGSLTADELLTPFAAFNVAKI